jgi:hypothetical protein
MLFVDAVIKTFTGRLGFTVTINALGIETEHWFADRLTEMGVARAVFPPFLAVKEGILLVPDSLIPKVVGELVHKKTVPATFPVRLIWGFSSPGQRLISLTLFNCGCGFTVTTTSKGVPVQSPDIGVTV